MRSTAREETTAEQGDGRNHSTESGGNNHEEPTTKQVNACMHIILVETN